jgi:hypothetical protein
MTLTQSIEIGRIAKLHGYAVRAKRGKLQFVTVVYNKKGESEITERTNWLSYDEARQIILSK